jgi:hypothetical protein
MNFLVILLTILSLAVLFYAIFKPKIGAALYLIYMFLAPYLYLGGFILYARTIAVFFLVLFLLKFKQVLKKEDYKPFIPYVIFLLFQFILLFSSSIFLNSLNSWFTGLSSLFFLLFLYGNMKVNSKNIYLYSKILFGISCVFTIYGLLLTLTPGLNPYQILVQPLFGQEFNEAYAAGNSGLSDSTELADGRLFGRISSLFSHPMIYGLNLGYFFIYSLFFLRKRPKILIIVLFFIIVAIVTSGVRTPMAALSITYFAMLLYMRNFRFFLYSILMIGIFIFLISVIYPESVEYISSIFNSDSSNVSGSSFAMRHEQLKGCFEIVKYDILTGKGYGWTTWYNSLHGTHPKALWFESLFYVILVNTGIMGFIIWGIFIYKYYKYIRKTFPDLYSRAIMLSLLLYYIVYCSITGDLGMNYFLLYFIVLLELMCLRSSEHNININYNRP